MKIKIIELLNLVYEKKAPKKVLYKYCEYEFDEGINDYKNKDGLMLFEHLFQYEQKALFLEIEIIEERSKEIEELELKYPENQQNNCYLINEQGTKCYLTKHSKMIAQKLNEVIKEINLLKKENDGKC